MLTQGKRKRTVEDFNQFCTFVLAYAGYIPYPNEEWQCNDSVPRDSSTCSPQHSEDWASFSSPQSYYGPSQSKRDAGAKLGKKLVKRINKEKGKRRKEEKRSVLDGERKPPKRGRDAGGGKKSSSPKGSSKKNVPQEPKFEMANGASLCGGFGMVGTRSAADYNPGCTATAGAQPRPEQPADSCSGTYRPSALKHEPQERTGYVDRANGDVKNIPMGCLGSAHANPSSVDTPVRPSDGLGEKRSSAGQEGKALPVDLTEASRTLQEAGVSPQEEEELDRQIQARDRCSEAKAEQEEEEEEEEDILRLVMERRLTGRVPDDQETGYHTDWASSTPEQAGSDTEQDTPVTRGNTAIGSKYATEDTSADIGKLEEEDDSWDLITCFCLKPFAGRPMIECGECATWVHLSCAKIRRAHVPDVFVCQPCRDAKQSIRRSNRARAASRKRFGD